jgi:hypothetical protein
VVRLHQTPEGSILDIGRKRRTIPPALRRALEARDRGCRFPGCGLRYTDAHHVEHWADGGETKLENLLCLCRHHHRLVHEEGWRVTWWGEGRPVFFDPRGGTHFDGRWEMPGLGGDATQDNAALDAHDPVSALIADNRRRGTEPDGWTAASRWEREEDVPADVFFPAVEAMGEG